VRVDEARKKMADGEDYNAINLLGFVPLAAAGAIESV
jgi:hypothetical protein